MLLFEKVNAVSGSSNAIPIFLIGNGHAKVDGIRAAFTRYDAAGQLVSRVPGGAPVYIMNDLRRVHLFRNPDAHPSEIFTKYPDLATFAKQTGTFIRLELINLSIDEPKPAVVVGHSGGGGVALAICETGNTARGEVKGLNLPVILDGVSFVALSKQSPQNFAAHLNTVFKELLEQYQASDCVFKWSLDKEEGVGSFYSALLGVEDSSPAGQVKFLIDNASRLFQKIPPRDLLVDLYLILQNYLWYTSPTNKNTLECATMISSTDSIKTYGDTLGYELGERVISKVIDGDHFSMLSSPDLLGAFVSAGFGSDESIRTLCNEQRDYYTLLEAAEVTKRRACEKARGHRPISADGSTLSTTPPDNFSLGRNVVGMFSSPPSSSVSEASTSPRSRQASPTPA